MEYTVKLRLLNPQAVAKMPDAGVVRRFVAYELESRGLSVGCDSDRSQADYAVTW